MARRMRGEGGVYKRGPVWWITYVIDGKRHRESTGARFKTGALAVLHEKLTAPTDRTVTVNELLDALVQDLELRQVKHVYRTTSHMKPLRAYFGRRKAASVNEEVVTRYQKARHDEGRSNGTINRECQLLGQAFKRGVASRLVARPLAIRKLPEHNVRRGFFTTDEVESVIEHLPDYLRDYVRFAYITGWRRGEVSNLLWENVHLNAGVLILPSERSKNNEARLLPLSGALVDLVQRRLAERVEDCPYVFHRNGEYIRDFRKAWRTATKRAGLVQQNVGGRLFHDLRRSAVRDMIRAGVRERVAMSVAGHKTRSIFDRYNISSERDIEDALARTERYRNETRNGKS